ncbi:MULTISPECIES: endonuclease III domain-containing protein [Enterococcus]|uniref:endonuclease III domain-containing protein n=1 Tax=Enterococcus TaxID=1350 RepID=UPI000EEE28AA|nr:MULTISPECIES: deoxyribonuclease I [Enterococcus]HCM84499.1 deoxyribonuclease I [Enterococcus sp.]
MIINIEELYTAFSQIMTHKRWWDTDNKWEILLGAVLVQNTNWRNVDYALVNLEEATQFLPEKVLALDKEQLQDLIRPSGFYKGKANTIMALLTWLEGYHFDLVQVARKEFSALRKELLAIKGIGEETADALLVYVFDHSTFIADKYAQRMFERFGFAAAGYKQLKSQIMWPETMDTLKAQNLHGWIIEYGQVYLKNDELWQSGPLKDFKLKLRTTSD